MSLEGHENVVVSASLGPDGKFIVSASGDGNAKVWDAATGKLLMSLDGHGEFVGSVSYSPDGKLIMTKDGTLSTRVWDGVSGKLLISPELNVVSLFSPDGKLIVIANSDGTASVCRIS